MLLCLFLKGALITCWNEKICYPSYYCHLCIVLFINSLTSSSIISALQVSKTFSSNLIICTYCPCRSPNTLWMNCFINAWIHLAVHWITNPTVRIIGKKNLIIGPKKAHFKHCHHCNIYLYSNSWNHSI